MAWYQYSPEIDGNALLVGASLSEPHTSVTAFAEVVCMYVWVVSCMRMPSPLSRRADFFLDEVRELSRENDEK